MYQCAPSRSDSSCDPCFVIYILFRIAVYVCIDSTLQYDALLMLHATLIRVGYGCSWLCLTITNVYFICVLNMSYLLKLQRQRLRATFQGPPYN
jgi:hypothetical protein